MVKVVYFNQWFSSITNVIEDLKNKHENSIKIIASSRNENHAYKDVVDVFLHETWEEVESSEVSMKNYVDFILDICKEYKVDYFFVKKNAKYIMKRSNEFFNNGTFLISEDYDTLSFMDYKSNVYDTLMETDLEQYVPRYWTFEDEGLAYTLLQGNKGKNDLCLKLNKDEGGASFRSIIDTKPDFNSLYKFRVNTITSDEAIDLIMREPDKVSRLLFMQLLDSPEISIDCYNSKNGFIALCRKKEGGRKQVIYYNEELSKLCEKFGKVLKLRFPFNVQFRVAHGQDSNKIENLRLLEINPRMSGGLYYEVFNGMNIAEACLLDMMNRSDEYSIKQFRDFEPKYVGYVEKAVHL